MLNIVFEDDYLMVIEKPAGLVVDRSDSQKEITLEDILSEKYSLNEIERSGIVHRLDKDTSGLMLVAKTTECWEKLKELFKERKIQKQYICLVHGGIKEEGVIDAPILRNPNNNERYIVHPAGREAITKYQPVKNLKFNTQNLKGLLKGRALKKVEVSEYGEFSLINCFPLTGRTHQIRVHMKYINHPILGDERYGGRKTIRVDRLWCKRQFLHAAKLEFTHPITQKKLSFESKLPEDLEQVLRFF